MYLNHITAMDGHEAVCWRSFRGRSGTVEHFIAIEAPVNGDIARQVEAVERLYEETLQTLGLSPQSAVFRRIFVSDAANQAAVLHTSDLFRAPPESPVAVSLVEQPPVSGAKLAMLSYHIESETPLVKRMLAPGHVLVERGKLHHLWSTGLCTANNTGPADAHGQTFAVFGALIDALSGVGGTLAHNCLRTWLYLKNVDVFYQQMVAARRKIFRDCDLTAATHYLASTGIEGACAHRYDVVLMDAYSVLGLAPGQVSYPNDLDLMCRTEDYSVTFERATRIAYADRAHVLISGTASIDASGKVLHVGDVHRQLDRALANIDGLLCAAESEIASMTNFIVYLRDPADRARIAPVFRERFPGVPVVMVEGAVCRPEWLIEVEGVAVSKNDAPELPAF
ncbi:Rid family hydrolase [Acidocella sp.]|uniref:Rid family hydrolase n=1 Tax=Acidocella sp. TaxID=50710 RepID=UPI002624F050|nr:Rid family hydrolase [Acidocella sp.]